MHRTNENGELVIVQFTPEGYVELDPTQVLNPTSRTGYDPTRPGSRARRRHGNSDRLMVWAHPAFANRHVVVRNDEEIIRVSLDEADYSVRTPTDVMVLSTLVAFLPMSMLED